LIPSTNHLWISYGHWVTTTTHTSHVLASHTLQVTTIHPKGLERAAINRSVVCAMCRVVSWVCWVCLGDSNLPCFKCPHLHSLFFMIISSVLLPLLLFLSLSRLLCQQLGVRTVLPEKVPKGVKKRIYNVHTCNVHTRGIHTRCWTLSWPAQLVALPLGAQTAHTHTLHMKPTAHVSQATHCTPLKSPYVCGTRRSKTTHAHTHTHTRVRVLR
jgi:hypothetical protein